MSLLNKTDLQQQWTCIMTLVTVYECNVSFTYVKLPIDFWNPFHYDGYLLLLHFSASWHVSLHREELNNFRDLRSSAEKVNCKLLSLLWDDCSPRVLFESTRWIESVDLTQTWQRYDGCSVGSTQIRIKPASATTGFYYPITSVT